MRTDQRRQTAILTERNAFRLVVAIAGLVPVGAGALGALLGICAFDHDWCAEFDPFLRTHFGYLSGLLLGIGLACWQTLKSPEAYTARYRTLTSIVALGGLARLWLTSAEGGPWSGANLFALVMELCVTPAICLWQARIARLGAQDAPRR